MIMETYGRTDLESLFSKSGIIEAKKLNHHPFIVFMPIDYEMGVRVEVVDNAQDLLAMYPDDTPVMVQWPGQWRSDFFKFTVGQMRDYTIAHKRLI